MDSNSQETIEPDPIVLTEFQKKVSEFVLDTPTPGKHSARNAILCLEKAWQLRHVDPNMAAFRAITAEEEAATAIFHALKRKNYKNADILQHKRHLHKLALHPFFQAIARIFHETAGVFNPHVVWNIDGKKPRIRLRLTLPGPGGMPLHMEPQLPLYFNTLVNGKEYDFSRELEKIATDSNMKTTLDHLRNIANFRNKILYAGAEGIPDVEIKDVYFLNKRNIVFIHLAIYLLIDDYKEHQLFAQQALNAFLKMLRIIPKDIDI